MKENLFELMMIAFIAIGIAVAIWKGGASNPEGTGSLGKKLGVLTSDFKTLDLEVKRIEAKAATKSDIRRVESTLVEHGNSIDNIEKKLGQLGEDGAAREATLEHVRRQVDLIYQALVKKGME